MEPPRWNVITPSQYEWERRGLDFIRTGLPDHDPYRAWANFEFQTADGAIYEVDLLVLTKLGFWLVECKAWGGHIRGDPGTWTISHGGKARSEDNPVLLANRKAKALASLLKAQPAGRSVQLEARKLASPLRRSRSTTASGHLSAVRSMTAWLMPNGLLTENTARSFPARTSTAPSLLFVVTLNFVGGASSAAA